MKSLEFATKPTFVFLPKKALFAYSRVMVSMSYRLYLSMKNGGIPKKNFVDYCIDFFQNSCTIRNIFKLLLLPNQLFHNLSMLPKHGLQPKSDKVVTNFETDHIFQNNQVILKGWQ